MNTDDNLEPVLKCGCWILVLLINFFIGGIAVNYLLDTFLSKTIPFFWAGVLGLFTAEFSITVAIVVYVLKFFGVI